jgi:two-component sensor histidine kinase
MKRIILAFGFLLPLSAFSQKQLDSLKRLLKQEGLADTTVVVIRNELAKQYVNLQFNDSALHVCRDNLQLLNCHKGLEKYRFDAFLTLSDVFEGIIKNDSAIFYLYKAVSVGEKFRNNNIWRVYFRLGNIYMDKGDYDSAMTNYKKSLYPENLDTNKKKKRHSMSLTCIGSIYSLKGNFQLSQQNFLAALELSEEINDSTLISGQILSIGANHFRLKNYEKALHYYLKSLKIAERVKNKLLLKIGIHYMNIAEVYSVLNKPDSAVFYGKKSFDFNQSFGLKKELGYSLHYLSLAYRSAKNWKLAIVEEKQSYFLHLEAENKTGCAESLQGLAQIYFEIGNYQESFNQAALALDLAKQIGSQPVQKDLFKIMAKTAYQMNQFSRANKYWQGYDSLNEILYEKEKLQQFANAEALYENNKKTLEIEELTQKASFQQLEIQQQKLVRNLTMGGIGVSLGLLSIIFYQLRLKRNNLFMLSIKKSELEEKNNSLQKLTDKLEMALTDKDLLLKETHHRIKNNLQIISSLLNLQNESNTPDKIKAIQGRILSMSLIHQRLYKQDNLVGVEFLSYTKELMESLEKMYAHPNRKINCVVEGKEFILNADSAIPLGLILFELITNSFKHGFNHSNSGSIRLSIGRESTFLTMDYYDSGPGLPIGFDISKSESLGMKLIFNLAAQLEGKFTFSSEDGYRGKFVFTNL